MIPARIWSGSCGQAQARSVFVIGHARSGTTLVHRLMSQDEGRFSFFVLYEMYFPSLLQKKVIRALAAFDRRWLGGFFERRVRTRVKRSVNRHP